MPRNRPTAPSSAGPWGRASRENGSRQEREGPDEPALVIDHGAAVRGADEARDGEGGGARSQPLERGVLEVDVLGPFRGARDLQDERSALGRELEVLIAFARELPGRDGGEAVKPARDRRRVVGENAGGAGQPGSHRAED